MFHASRLRACLSVRPSPSSEFSAVNVSSPHVLDRAPVPRLSAFNPSKYPIHPVHPTACTTARNPPSCFFSIMFAMHRPPRAQLPHRKSPHVADIVILLFVPSSLVDTSLCDSSLHSTRYYSNALHAVHKHDQQGVPRWYYPKDPGARCRLVVYEAGHGFDLINRVDMADQWTGLTGLVTVPCSAAAHGAVDISYRQKLGS
ncbi:hypothetical protein BDN71DRAFT_631063 [Pleurotus eryngii]|uniref:Uncharacterized protein n=1 Tax=Pleurotus eryngii TaxID=5323 RepID=A0A9P5ZHC0_PLEER|nr:hypothetical protein BDN71DRAFT_631063 [Pleurotus eryngii]